MITTVTTSSSAATAVVKASDSTKSKSLRVSGRDVLSIDVMIDKFVSYVGTQDLPSASSVNKQWKNRVTVRLRLFEGLPCTANQVLQPTPLQDVYLQIYRLKRSLFSVSGQTNFQIYNLENERTKNREKWGKKQDELLAAGIPKYSLVTTLVKIPLIGSRLFSREAQRQKLQQECDDLSARADSLQKLDGLITQKKALQTKWHLLNLVGGAKAAEKIPAVPEEIAGKLSSLTSPIMKVVSTEGDLIGLIITGKQKEEFVSSLRTPHELFHVRLYGSKIGLVERTHYFLTEGGFFQARGAAFLTSGGKRVMPALYEWLRCFLQNGEALLGGADRKSRITQIAPKTLQREISQRYPSSKKFQLKRKWIEAVRYENVDLYEKLRSKYL